MNTAPLTADTFAARKENLRRLVLDKYEGNRAALARAAAVHQNQINLLLSDNDEHRRNMGEALARRVESTLSLPLGYLDTVRDPSVGSTHSVGSWDVPQELWAIIGKSDDFVESTYHEGFFRHLEGKITGKENLRYARVVSNDMAPDVLPGDCALVDIGVKAVSGDGIYVLQQGGAFFLRRVVRTLQGGWAIQSTKAGIGEVHVDSLKGIKAVCRIVTVHRHAVL